MKALFLIGFMGSGKSTIGRLIARELGWDFYDLDEEVEKVQGQSIPDLFKNLGEDKFRELEKRALHDFENKARPFVLATGGGTPCFYGNMEWMKERGSVLFIDVPPEELIHRLQGTAHGRPILNAMNPEKFGEETRILLEKRRPIYLQAPWILGKNGLNLDEVIHMLNS